MLKNKVVLQSWQDNSVAGLFQSYGAIVTRDPEDDYDLAVFTGGADICPFLYGEKAHPSVYGYLARDMHEIKLLRQIPFGTPVIGICRGAQLLNVMAGGSMYQDVNNHVGSNHDAVVVGTGEIFHINSIHHQQMIPAGHADRLLMASVATRKVKDDQTITLKEAAMKNLNDVEAIWIPQHNYLCFQAHPEYVHDKAPTRVIFDRFVKDKILPLLNKE